MVTNDSTVDDTFAQFLNFGAGVLSLVFLSCSVIWGLLAQDRIVLDTRQRILAQAVHRTTAVASVVFLLVHIVVKLVLDHTTWVAAVLPFGLLATEDEAFGGRAVLIGFGTLASMLMIFVGVTGALRNRFASPAPVAARWRAMHMLAYPAWCLALLHGLYAGRAAKPVFVVLYALSVVGVMAALALRAAPRPVKRKVADRIAGLLGTGERPAREEDEEAAENRPRATAALPGYEGAGRSRSRGASPSAPLYEPAERLTAPEPPSGFAAAYRAVSGPSGAGRPPLTADPAAARLPSDLRPTEAMPVVDGGGSTSGSWPIPSPPPVGEAPRRPTTRSTTPDTPSRSTAPRRRWTTPRPTPRSTPRPLPRATARVTCTTPVRRTRSTTRTTPATRTTAVPPLNQPPVRRRRPTTSTHRVPVNLGTRLPEA